MTEWGQWTPPPAPPAGEYVDITPTGDAAIVCPHCQTQGAVTTRSVKLKKGVSGAKATGAVLTLGWSMLATGLSRKEQATELRCGNCRMRWTA
jgi:hypothetical protein